MKTFDPWLDAKIEECEEKERRAFKRWEELEAKRKAVIVSARASFIQALQARIAAMKHPDTT